MALFMVANDLTRAEVEDPEREIAFPESVVSLFRGELGFPPDGFPSALQTKVLKGGSPLPGRAGDSMPPADLEAHRAALEALLGRAPSENELASHLMYPKVFRDYVEHRKLYGDVSQLPTPAFFHGLRDREEIAVEIDRGKTLIIRQTGRSDSADDEGRIKVFFELNGQPRMARIHQAGAEVTRSHPRIEDGNPNHIGAPMPGAVVTVSVREGQKVRKGSPLVSIEAMKMETAITAERDATVLRVLVTPGDRIEAKDLLVELG
jgi:pyruvate carboxylase